MAKNSNLPPFYSKDLKEIRTHAKSIASHPILGNLEHINTQLNVLKASHRRFIFASLTKQFGEMRARDLAQSEKIKKLVDNFDDLDHATAEALEKESKNESKNFVGKFKLGVFDANSEAHEIHAEVIKNIRSQLPDLLKPIKVK